MLGPLEVRGGTKEIAVPAGKLRALLATLALRMNRTVSIDELAEMVWEDVRPVDSRSTLQKYVMRLRRLLGDTDAAIRTEPNGYRLELPPEQSDLGRFTWLVEEGKRVARSGDSALASERLTEAVELWRDIPPLANVETTRLHTDEVPLLVERYLEAVEMRIDADLALGRHRDVSAELLGLLRSHPLRERFWAQRMRALSASGRRGEALAAYREVAALLADELGIEPGPELKSVHRMILRAEGSDIAGAHLATRPHEPIATLVKRLLTEEAG